MVVVVWVYGIMGLTGYELNSQTVTIGALTLGLGVDYAVHLTTRLEEEVEHAPFADPQNGRQNPWQQPVEQCLVLHLLQQVVSQF